MRALLKLLPFVTLFLVACGPADVGTDEQGDQEALANDAEATAAATAKSMGGFCTQRKHNTHTVDICTSVFKNGTSYFAQGRMSTSYSAIHLNVADLSVVGCDPPTQGKWTDGVTGTGRVVTNSAAIHQTSGGATSLFDFTVLWADGTKTFGAIEAACTSTGCKGWNYYDWEFYPSNQVICLVK